MIAYTYPIAKEDYVNAGKVSSQIKRLLKEISLDNDLIRRIAVASYEAEINMIIHSDGGEIFFNITSEEIKLVFADRGPGISDIEQALTPGYTTASDKAREFGFGAGMGLPNIKRVTDQFSIDSSPLGTTITLLFEV